jgi:hypothetical protein
MLCVPQELWRIASLPRCCSKYGVATDAHTTVKFFSGCLYMTVSKLGLQFKLRRIHAENSRVVVHTVSPLMHWRVPPLCFVSNGPWLTVPKVPNDYLHLLLLYWKIPWEPTGIRDWLPPRLSAGVDTRIPYRDLRRAYAVYRLDDKTDN